MINYVKFSRGTKAEYFAQESYDEDTLYFISNPDSDVGELYLGNVLIASGIHGAENGLDLNDLQDVLVTELTDTSLLVYDIEQKKWINKSIEEFTFSGNTATAGAIAGLVPPVKAGTEKLYLCSDGTWAAITSSEISAGKIISVENIDNIPHLELLAETISNPRAGDIIIIQDILTEQKYEHFGYIYNGSAWIATVDNYKAESVIFTEDLVTTTAIGNISLVNGKAIIPSKGKNLKEVFETIFVHEKNPKITSPKVMISMDQNEHYFEVGTEYHPAYTASFDEGVYEFGPNPTGVSLLSWRITDSQGHSSNQPSGTFDSILLDDETEYFVTAEATYTEGLPPITNLGNSYNEGTILSGSASATISTFISGYRNAFYGTFADKEEITSNSIRTLTASNKRIEKGTNIIMEIPLQAQRVVIAYEADLGEITSIKDSNALNTEIITAFGAPITVAVEGANGYQAKPYLVYILDYAYPNNIKNYYTITI